MRKRFFRDRGAHGTMLRKAVAFVSAVAIAGSCIPAAAFAAPEQDNQASAIEEALGYKDGEILVTFDNAKKGRHSTQSADALSDKLEDSLGAESVDVIADANASGGTVVSVDLASGMSVESAVETASKVSGVADAQPNYVYHLLESDNSTALYDDPYMNEQYYLDSWDAKANGRGANVEAAWDTAIANHSVSIAILDTGARVDHQDLQENIDTTNMWDAYTYPNAAEGRGKLVSNSNPSGDRNGHGSHVAGIAAGAAGNGVGIAGASGNANIIPIKVFNNDSYNPGAETSTLVKAYNYLLDLVDKGEITDLHVINMSLGSYAMEGRDESDEALEKAIGDAKAKGILTVCAGGNGNDDGTARTDAMYPSDYDDVLSVTALEPDGTNVSWSDYNESKDISAPGVDILSCYNQGPASYTTMDGTSMASPLVAGIASLLWAAKPDLTVDEAVTAIETTAQPLDANGANYHGNGDIAAGSSTGSHGAINAAAAVASVASGAVSNYKRMADCSIDAIGMQLMKTGTETIEPAVTVKDAQGAPVDPSNYQLRYSANKTVGTATVLAIGQGSYIGSTKTTFDIKYDFSQATGIDLVLAQTQFAADGQEHKPATLGVHNRADRSSTYVLAEGVDYEVAYPADTSSVGTKVVTLTGKGDYSGTRSLSYTISAAPTDGGGTTPEPTPTPTPTPSKINVKTACSIANIPDQTYTGKAITPTVTVTAGQTSLTAGTDYEVAYAYNEDAGIATAQIKGKGSYTGTLAQRFRIVPVDISEATATFTEAPIFTGDELKPAVSVQLDGKALTQVTDFEVAYFGNINAGTGAAIINGVDNYSGYVVATFTIDKSAQAVNAKAKKASIKKAQVKKKARTVTCITGASSTAGKISYKKVSGSSKLSVNTKTGAVKVKKGTKRGTYKAQVAVKAAETTNYLAASKTLTITVVVK